MTKPLAVRRNLGYMRDVDLILVLSLTFTNDKVKCKKMSRNEIMEKELFLMVYEVRRERHCFNGFCVKKTYILD